MKVTIAQKEHKIGKKDKNLEIIQKTAKKIDTDLLIFPEMFLTGYTLRDRLWYESEPVPGPSSEKISSIASKNDMNIIFGMPEKSIKDGRLRNSAILTTSEGKIHTYRKSYLPNFGPFEDKRYFHSDDEIPVFDTNFGRVGIVICYDVFFPELTKAISQKGADYIVVISASPSVTREYFESILPARAIETTSYILYSNLVGREESMFFWGGAEIISPKGRSIAKAGYFEEELLEKELRECEIEKARRGRPVIGDTRPEMMYRAADSTIMDENNTN